MWKCRSCVCTFSWGLLELVAAPGLDWQPRRMNPPWSARWPPSAPWHIDQDSLCLVHGGLDPERCLHRPRIWSYGWTQNRVFHFVKKKKRKVYIKYRSSSFLLFFYFFQKIWVWNLWNNQDIDCLNGLLPLLTTVLAIQCCYCCFLWQVISIIQILDCSPNQ